MENVYPIKSKTGVCRGISIFLSFAPKHKIAGTSLNRLGEAVITCTHNLQLRFINNIPLQCGKIN